MSNTGVNVRQGIVSLLLVIFLLGVGAGGIMNGVHEINNPPEPNVEITYDFYAHDIPRDIPPQSWVSFDDLSTPEKNAFRYMHTNEGNSYWEQVSGENNSYSSLENNEYVKYHGRWYSITTQKDISQDSFNQSIHKVKYSIIIIICFVLSVIGLILVKGWIAQLTSISQH